MPLDPYPIIELRGEDVQAPEEMGSKRKGWVQIPGRPLPWLFKYARMNEGIPTGEAWAEKVAAEIAELIELPAARVDLARLDGQVGSVSQRFPELAEADTELEHGSDLLPGAVLGYDRNRVFHNSDHTLENILNAVARVIPHGPARDTAFGQLAGFVVLDALILNTDRHHENWALLRKTQAKGPPIYRVAPSFDHASSLARNESPEKLEAWLREKNRAQWYARRGRSHGAIYLPGEPKGANPLRLAEVAARRWPAYFAPWLGRVRSLEIGQIADILQRVPATMISASQQEFALALVRYTRVCLGAIHV